MANRYVLVTVKHASNLKDTELLGKQEPYVRLELGGATTETSTERGISPVFNEQVKLPLPSSYSAIDDLHVSCYNEKTLLPDRLIGRGTVSLSSARSQGSQTVPLYDKKGNPAGHVVLDVQVHDGAHNSATHGTATGAAASPHTHGTHHTSVDKSGVETTTSALAATHLTSSATTTDNIPFRPTGGRVISAEHHATVTDQPIVKEVHEQYAVHSPVLHQAVAETRHVGDVSLAPTAEVVAERDEVVDERVSPAAAVPAPKQFAVVEDRAVVKEQVSAVRETTPVERLYQVETRETGTRRLDGSAEVIAQREAVLDERHTGAPVLPKPQAFSSIECNEVVKERHDRYVETSGVAKTFAEETKKAGERALPGTAEVVGERTVLREV